MTWPASATIGRRMMRAEIAKMTYQFPISVIQLRITEAVATR
jgi:hypothetical protein